jgi:hypothetical protein
MKKATVLLLLLFFCCTHVSYAQGWKWARDSKIAGFAVEEGGPVCIDSRGNVFGINAIGSLLFSPGLFTSTYGPYAVADSLDMSQSVVYSLDSTGNYRWAVGTYGDRVELTNIFTDDAGYVFLSGNTTAPVFAIAGMSLTGAGHRFFIAKLDPLGHGVWIKAFPAGIDVSEICVGHAGEIYFTGDLASSPVTVGSTTLTSNRGKDVIFGQYDSSGNAKWALSFGGDSSDIGMHISLTATGAAYVSGSSSSTSLIIGSDTLVNPRGIGNTILFVSRLDTGKNIIWSRSIIPSPAGGAISGIASGSVDELYCGGTYYTQISSGSDTLPLIAATRSQMFLFKYDSSGNLKWGRTMADTSLHSAAAVEADYCGNIWVSGAGGRSSGPGGDPMFLARFDSSGNLKDTVPMASGGDDANWIRLDKNGNLYVSGDYEHDPFSLGDETLDSARSTEVLFVAKYIYALPGCVIDTVPYHHIKTMAGAVNSNTNTVSLYPNPAKEVFTIHSDIQLPKGACASLYDISGRLIAIFTLEGVTTELKTAGLLPGMYQCRITGAGVVPIIKKLVVMK